MFKLLFVSGTTACFELENTNPYYAPEKYRVTLNGEAQGEEKESNVFSLFNLTPDTEYVVGTTADSFTLKFRTEKESGCVNVKDLGAKGDGVSDDTYYLQMAIDSCPKGGRVIIPEGSFYTRPLVLASDKTIEIQKDGELLGDIVEEHYPYVPAKIEHDDGSEEILATWEGNPYPCHQSFLSAYKKENIKIVGEGTINGNADKSTWWATPKGRAVARPRLVTLNKCKNVVLHGVTCKNSAAWNLHPFFSEDLGFYDLRVQNPYTGPNTDGLDPESCNRVNIVGCVFSVGDDCVAIKAGKLYMGAKYKTPANNHTIRNDLFQNGHGAIVLGSEISGGVKNLTVCQCVFKHTDRGLRIKSRRGRGKDSIIDGVVFENIKMINVITPLVINMYYFCDPDGHTEYVWSREKHPVGADTPYMGKFVFKDIECTECECMCAYFDGLVEQPVKEVVLENVSFSFKEDAKPFKPAMLEHVREYCKEGMYIDNVEKVTLKNVTFDGVVGENIIKRNCNKLTVI